MRRRFAMQPCRAAAALERRHALGQEPGDEAGKHIARSGGRQLGGALVEMATRPSGAAMAVSGPFNSTTQPACRRRFAHRFDAASANSSSRPGNRRSNSPSCGVSTVAGRNWANSASGSAAKEVSASASSTRRAACQHRGAQFLRRRADAAARPDDDGVEALVLQQAATARLRPSNGLTMIAVRCAALTAHGVGRARDADQPRADTQRTPRRQPRRAGGVRRTADDQRMAAAIFVAERIGLRERHCPKGSAVLTKIVGGFQRRIGNADLRQRQRVRIAAGPASAHGPVSCGRRSP